MEYDLKQLEILMHKVANTLGSNLKGLLFQQQNILDNHLNRGRLRKKIGSPNEIKFHTLRDTFATRMENLGIPSNHISQLMGHKDNSMSLDVYSAGMKIEPLVESINKLTYGDEIDSFVKDTLKNSN